MSDDTESKQAEIYAVLAANPKATLSEIEAKTGVSRPTVVKWRNQYRAENNVAEEGGESDSPDPKAAHDFRATFPAKKRKKKTTPTTPMITEAANEVEISLV